jgi:hypothetical protein
MYNHSTPMGSSRPVISGRTVVKTERDFPAVWNKVRDHRLAGGGLFL